MFGAARTAPAVAAGDEAETVQTTQGFLTNGNSLPMVVFGGIGNDTINVFANRGLTKLYGESGNDTFVIRAFVLANNPAKQAGGGETQVFGGEGEDKVLYNINAPLSIDGGSGTDTIVIIGTEMNDSFVITDQGIYGAGLNIGYDNIERLEVDGLEGDDTFYVLSTPADVVVTIIGGNGSDTISVGGDVMTNIVSLEVEGTSGIVNHAVFSADASYNDIFVRGLRTNVASAANGLFEVDTSGLAALDEGGAVGFYRIRMTTALASTVYLTVSAARASSEDRAIGDGSAKSVLVGAAPANLSSAFVMAFTNTTAWQTVYVQAPEDTAAEGLREVLVNHSATGTTQAVAAKIANVSVAVVDNDVAALRIAGNPSVLNVVEGGATAEVKLSLTQKPAVGEVVTVRLTLPAGLAANLTELTFNDSNWNVERSVTVSAVDDSLAENTERVTLRMALTSNQIGTAYASATASAVDVRIADNDRGEVLITETGGRTIVAPGAPDSYSIVLTKQPTANVVVSILTDGQTVASSSDARFAAGARTVTFTSANWNIPVEVTLSVGTVNLGAQPTVKFGAQAQVISAIRGPVYVFGGVSPDADRAIKPGLKLPTETDIALPAISNPVNENLQTDRLVVFNAGAVTNQSGILTEDRLSGFGMGSTDVVLDFGSGGVSDLRTFRAGINYEGLEVVEVLLGSGNDELTINSTAAGAITTVHGGGGDDKLRVVATGGAAKAQTGGDSRVLVLLGDTTQDGGRYSSSTAALNGSGRAFVNGGKDLIDAGAAAGSVILFGGVGDDTLVGSAFDDHILGGSGNDSIDGGAGSDHLYGDNGLNLDLSKRNDLQPQLITVVSVRAAGDAATGDALLAAGSDVIKASGSAIVIADFGRIDQESGVNRAFQTGKVTTVVSLREGEGGNDVITLGAGNDIVMAGAGADQVTSTGGDDVVFGDIGTLTVDGGKRIKAASSATALTGAHGDTIGLGAGSVWVIGGAGADRITFADGGGVVLGDDGEITATSGGDLVKVTSTNLSVGGDDVIVGGNGTAVVIGGLGADKVTLGTGDHVVAGDIAALEFTTGKRTKFASLEGNSGTGTDTIGLGVGAVAGSVAGSVWVIGGAGADRITFADGGGVVLGDDGEITATSGGDLVKVTSTNLSVGGDDVIVGGNGTAVVIGGLGADKVTLGTGDHMVAGDIATLDFTTGKRTKFASLEGNSGSGTDTIGLGNGSVWVIGGAGADGITVADGGGVVLGDDGEITATSGGDLVKVTSTNLSVGGDDVITGGNGTAVVIGGLGADKVTLGTGDHIVAGDIAALDFTTGKRTKFASLEGNSGSGTDTIGLGNGSVWVIGGAGADGITVADGGGVVLGDDGEITATSGGDLIKVTSINLSVGGDDVILGGNGTAVVIGGLGADKVTLGTGDHIVAGDIATLDFTTGKRTKFASLEGNSGTGTDTIGLGAGSVGGSVWVIGGAGADGITVADGGGVVLGDDGEITATSGGDLVKVTSTNPSVGGDDVILGGNGTAVVIGGLGADKVTLGTGDHIVAGDIATLDFNTGKRTKFASLEGNSGTVADDTIGLGVGAVAGSVAGSVWVIGGAGADGITVADGGGVVLGDDGEITATSGGDLVKVTSTNLSVGGDDVILGGNGTAVVIGGLGADKVTLGTGDHIVAGDIAALDFTTGKRTKFASLEGNAGSGTDTIGLGVGAVAGSVAGSVWVIGGAGADGITVADGGGVILGDDGEITAETDGKLIKVISTNLSVGGDDVITGGNGTAVVIGGTEADEITLGTGDHVVAGDIATLDFTAGKRTTFASQVGRAGTGTDTIALGSGSVGGSVWVIGGAGNDGITVADGGGVILGDDGEITAETDGKLIKVVSTNLSVGGDDVITGGDGTAVVIGGLGKDGITLGNGDHIVAGDVGEVTFVAGVRKLFVGEIKTPALGGDDTLSTQVGNVWAILGEGDDSAVLAGGLNVVLGDAGRIEGDADGMYLTVTSTQSSTGGNDTLQGGTGRDLMTGGAGRDSLNGGAGADFLTGDGALIVRTPELGEIMIESIDITEGGDDTLVGGDGRDVMIGGIGDDLFDLVLGDDIVVGEFMRLRMTAQPDGSELVTSFLSPAVRDLDLLAQLTLGLNLASGETEVTEAVTTSTYDPFVMLGGMRLDLVLSESEVAEVLGGLGLVPANAAAAPGLAGFSVLAEPPVLGDAATEPAAETPPAAPAPEQQGRADGVDGRGEGPGWRVASWLLAGRRVA